MEKYLVTKSVKETCIHHNILKFKDVILLLDCWQMLHSLSLNIFRRVAENYDCYLHFITPKICLKNTPSRLFWFQIAKDQRDVRRNYVDHELRVSKSAIEAKFSFLNFFCLVY